MQATVALMGVMGMALVASACTGLATSLEPAYTRAMVEPIEVVKRSDTMIALRYRVHPESGYYAGGVNYEQVGDAMHVVIERCAVNASCSPMSKSVLPLDDRWQAEVHLPFRGQAVVLKHADGDARIYP